MWCSICNSYSSGFQYWISWVNLDQMCKFFKKLQKYQGVYEARIWFFFFFILNGKHNGIGKRGRINDKYKVSYKCFFNFKMNWQILIFLSMFWKMMLCLSDLIVLISQWYTKISERKTVLAENSTVESNQSGCVIMSYSHTSILLLFPYNHWNELQ